MIAAISDVAAAAPWAFLVGLGVGFVVGAKFRIEKRSEPDDGG